MPFEPIRTDEARDRRSRKRSDFDTQMLFGCSGFVGASVLTYALAVWPHLAWSDTHSSAVLGLGLALGLGPACVFGGFVARRFGLAGAAGFFAGSMASATFLFLRLQQVMAFRGIPDTPQPDYPYAWMWIVPLGWVLLSAILALLFVPKDELFGTEDRD